MTQENGRMLLASMILAGTLCGSAAMAQDTDSLFGVEAMGLTYGTYLRAELGADISLIDQGYWDPPGASDPRVYFGLDDENAPFGSVAVGFDWMNGVRADLALSLFGAKDVAGDWSFTVPATPGPHASVAASVSSAAVMGNVYYSPFETRRSTLGFSPYITAGLGFSRNEMDDWSRFNAASAQPVRTFEGDTNTDFAWSIGFGASWQVEGFRDRLVFIDAGIRYFDLGDAQGGATPLPGNGSSTPRTPLTVGLESTVVSLGVRVPLGQ